VNQGDRCQPDANLLIVTQACALQVGQVNSVIDMILRVQVTVSDGDGVVVAECGHAVIIKENEGIPGIWKLGMR